MGRIIKFQDGEFFTTEKLSPHIEKTPEGYLVCHDVPISRTGEFIYAAEESGVSSLGGISRVRRTPEELFREQTIRSFEGKPVTLGHTGFIRPQNWRQYAVGMIQNAHRGTGADADKLMADLMITDARGIRAVEEGRCREVSCGYHATAVDDGAGVGHQEGIVGNHVAFVRNGRCGETCAIRDEAMREKSLKSRLRSLFKDGDEERFNEALDDVEVTDRDAAPAAPAADPSAPPASAGGEGGDDNEARFQRLEFAMGELTAAVKKLQAAQAPAEPVADAETTGEEPAAPAEEEAPAEETAPAEEPAEETVPEEEAREVISDAEAVDPDFQRPEEKEITDGMPRAVIDRLARRALAGSAIGRDFKDAATLRGKALTSALKAAALMARSGNNPRAVGFKDHASTRTNADLNKAFNAYWRK